MAPKKIAVYNYKGGIGKSTIASNVAAGLARIGFRTSIWNTDGQNNSIRFLKKMRFDGIPTLYDVLKEDGIPVKDALIEIGENLTALPSSRVGSISTNIASRFERIDLAMENMLPEEQMKDFDYVIFDMGPLESKLNSALFNYVDSIIMPVQTEFACVDAIPLTYKYLTDNFLKEDLIKVIVPNMLEKNNGKIAAYAALKETSPEEKLVPAIPKRAAIHDAGMKAIPVYDYEKSRNDKDIIEPFLEIVRKVVYENGKQQKK